MGAVNDPSASESRCRGEGLGALLERWQSDRDADAIAMLVHRVHVPLRRIVAHTLRRQGILDPGACDDAMSLVFERLCRLDAVVGGMPSVRFDVARGPPGADAGWCYLLCLARSQARDVARALRRRERLASRFATSAANPRDAIHDEKAMDATDVARLHTAVAALDERSRELVSLLLDGKSQVVIAHVLGVCEGTVSRMRTQVIARLQAALAPKNGGGAT